MTEREETMAAYEVALEDFISRIKKDSNIIAGILYGSMVSGKVWEKSDLDLLFISKDETKPYSQFWLVDGDIKVQVSIESRRHFRRTVESSLESSHIFHILSTSRLLFCEDESLTGYIENASRIGERDRQMQMMRHAVYIPGDLEKVEKALSVYDDHLMAFGFLLHAVENTARLEIVREGQIPGREFFMQARECSPELMREAYTDILESGVTRERVKSAFEAVSRHLESISSEVYRPVLDFILQEGGHCGSTRIDAHFRDRLRMSEGDTVIGVCEWLADLGVVERMPLPILLTSRSREPAMEAAYYYAEEDFE
jgi:predicted nucleotidyltransferase